MPKYRHMQNSFIAGELSPRVQGRTETSQYQNGLQTCENMIVHPQGGAAYRRGSTFVKDLGYDKEFVKIIPFKASQNKSYVVIVFDGFIDVFDPSSNILSANVTNQDEGELPYVGFTPSQLKQIQYTQTGDIMWLCHPDHEPMIIVRTSDDSFVFSTWQTSADISPQPDNLERRPWINETDSAIILTLDTTSNPDRITASDSFFIESHVGAEFILTDLAALFLERRTVTAFIDDQTVEVTADARIKPGYNVIPDGTEFGSSSAANADSSWWESSWSDARGWPRTVEFFQQRLSWGGTLFEPQVIYFSETGDLIQLSREETIEFDSGRTVLATDEFKAAPNTGNFNEIQSLSPGRSAMNISTTGGELFVTPADSSAGFSVSNIEFSVETTSGGDYVKSVRVANTWIFVQRSGRKVYEFVFNRDEDAFNVEELTLIGEHIPTESQKIFTDKEPPKLCQIEYQEAKNKIIWALDTNGQLVGLTRDRRASVAAWHRHKITGSHAKRSAVMLAANMTNGATTTFQETLSTRGQKFIHKDNVVIRNYDGATTAVNGEHEIDVTADVDFDIAVNSTGDSPLTSIKISSAAEYPVARVDSICVIPSPDADYDDLYLAVTRKVDGADKTILEKIGKEYLDDSLSNPLVGIDSKPAFADASVLRQRVFHASYATEVAPEITLGTLDDTVNVAGIITSGKLDLTIANTTAVSSVAYFSHNSFDALRNKGSMRMLYTPDYTGSPAADRYFFTMANNFESSRNVFKMLHDSGGAIQFTINDDDSASSTGTLFSSWAPTAGVQYEIELNWDFFENEFNIFIDGVLSNSSTLPITYLVRTDIYPIRQIIIGGDQNQGAETSDAFFSQVSFHDHILHTAAYTSKPVEGHKDITGLSHLEGKSLAVTGDGSYLGTFTVANGFIILEAIFTDVIAGLPYTGILKTLTPNFGSAIGASNSAPIRVDRLTLRIVNSAGAKFGDDLDNLEEIDFRDDSLPGASPNDLFSGDKTVDYTGTYDRKQEIIVSQDKPLPLIISSIITRGVVND